MSMHLDNLDRAAAPHALLAELATKVEILTAEQASLRSETELRARHAISGCVQEIVLRRQRAVFLLKLGITLISVPALTYATFITSSVVHATPHEFVSAAALMAVLACSRRVAPWRRPFDLMWCSLVSVADRNASRQLERRLRFMRLDMYLPAASIDWRLGQVKWQQRSEPNALFSRALGRGS